MPLGTLPIQPPVACSHSARQPLLAAEAACSLPHARKACAPASSAQTPRCVARRAARAPRLWQRGAGGAALPRRGGRGGGRCGGRRRRRLLARGAAAGARSRRPAVRRGLAGLCRRAAAQAGWLAGASALPTCVHAGGACSSRLSTAAISARCDSFLALVPVRIPRWSAHLHTHQLAPCHLDKSQACMPCCVQARA
jgi:hypothetical protein